ncbi:UDP-3-O-(3-hydroxymyristoyl)glucosamine N-acyltransferase [Paenibacillus urinalis]|uniref:UDP-3-O-(3-hydroxymyristoyl)glucosamine N-acyltransferase n=1 Tax=Paenibacillus urinalis TaxID=521520 RepID=UPI0023680183|nr:UDP-3-O-(3-hydroxymyristoyl)glucosamine N-acyltransferase [Paenibacillus urinalis]WDH99682.1 UDP-3-O-(3-hydroxymyristoyl)glucosamine N-acyltransferase [Paenibacillus urinalis]
MEYKLKAIAQELNGELIGDGEVTIHSIASLSSAESGQITYVTEKNISKLTDCRASAIVVPEKLIDAHLPVIRVKNPRLAFVHVMNLFQQDTRANGLISSSMVDCSLQPGESTQIDEGTVVKENVSIGEGTLISSNCFIGENVTIGDHCFIHPHVTILSDTWIGSNVIIHSGAVIGCDGFGYEWDGQQHVKIPHAGNVVIHDDVEIGANTTIDRGTIDPTIIERGTKIDNLVQIAHNVRIGKQCIIAGTTAIAGSASIGDHVVLAGGSAVVGHLTIGAHSTILGKSNITKDLPAHSIISGYYARPHHEQLRKQAAIERLPHTLKKFSTQIDSLEKSIKKLTKEE